MKVSKIIGILCLLVLPLFSLQAQKVLKTDSIFTTYGMQKESILVVLSTDVLSKNSKITYYKSLVMPGDVSREAACAKAIEGDVSGGSRLIETQKNGRIETGYYVLKKNKKEDDYEYILYKNKSKKLTLVYLKGNFPPQQLENELDKLKDLFIYVNKKRIKLEN